MEIAMGIRETSVIYAILGVVVAAAMALREPRPSAGRLCFLFLAGVPFWPLFAPSLLGGAARRAPGEPAAPDGFEGRIRGAEAQILGALAKVKGGVAGGALAPEEERVKHLSGSLRKMAARFGEIEEMLGAPEFNEAQLGARLADLRARGHGDDPRAKSLEARLRDVERLRGMRTRTQDDLERALCKMEEITSQMLLLKLAGKPETEVAALIDAIADGVEGVAEAIAAVG
jgi:hypothetical protein